MYSLRFSGENIRFMRLRSEYYRLSNYRSTRFPFYLDLIWLYLAKILVDDFQQLFKQFWVAADNIAGL